MYIYIYPQTLNPKPQLKTLIKSLNPKTPNPKSPNLDNFNLYGFCQGLHCYTYSSIAAGRNEALHAAQVKECPFNRVVSLGQDAVPATMVEFNCPGRCQQKGTHVFLVMSNLLNMIHQRDDQG